jgi:Domain of unknown function (DUF5615)
MLDANLSSRRIGDPLRSSGHDVRGVTDEPGLAGLDDEPLLELATQDARILVTRNSRDFAPICRQWAEAGREHAGVILIWSLSSRQFGEIARGVESWLEQIPSAAEWRGTVVAV